MLKIHRRVIEETIELLGAEIVLAHAKDVIKNGEARNRAAGTDLLDYPYYLALLRSIGYDRPLLFHSLAESQFNQAAEFLRKHVAQG